MKSLIAVLVLVTMPFLGNAAFGQTTELQNLLDYIEKRRAACEASGCTEAQVKNLNRDIDLYNLKVASYQREIDAREAARQAQAAEWQAQQDRWNQEEQTRLLRENNRLLEEQNRLRRRY